MKRSAADLFERIAKRCPYDPGSGGWANWISGEMRVAEEFEDRALKLRRETEDENRRHAQAMVEIQKKWVHLQQYCKHDTIKRGTAESTPVCQDCGKENP